MTETQFKSALLEDPWKDIIITYTLHYTYEGKEYKLFLKREPFLERDLFTLTSPSQSKEKETS